MIPLILILVVVGAGAAFASFPNRSKTTILTDNLSVPSNGTTAAKVDINPGDGNLRIDPATGSEPVLVSGALQYGQKQGTPAQSLTTDNGLTVFSVKANKSTQRWSALPWAACNGATDWKLFLKPGVSLDLTTHSDGGNIALNLAGLTVTHVQADTGGGNIDLTLPDTITSLDGTAKTGAGNVTVIIPDGVAARLHLTTGLGKVIIDPRFTKIDEKTYQSAGYDTAASKVELTLQSGAGNINVATK